MPDRSGEIARNILLQFASYIASPAKGRIDEGFRAAWDEQGYA